MTRRYGIDTSVLVRLVTRDPESEFRRCVEESRALIEDEDAEIFVSNQVVGEAYVAVRHHYGIPAPDARSGLLDSLTSGLISPLNGQSVILALRQEGGAGLFDRLITDDHSRSGLETLTLDRRIASLRGARRL